MRGEFQAHHSSPVFVMYERSRTGAVDIIRGADPLSGASIRQLSAVLDECLSAGQPRLVIDLEKVPLIDSEGLELLLSYQDRCVERGGSMKLSGLNPLCADILSVTDVDTHFDIFRDCLSAVGSFVA